MEQITTQFDSLGAISLGPSTPMAQYASVARRIIFNGDIMDQMPWMILCWVVVAKVDDDDEEKK